MSKRTLEETLALIEANDTTYVEEVCSLYHERRALRNIVLGARHRVENMLEVYREEDGAFTQGCVFQAKHDLEVIEFVVSMYELDVDEQEAK